MNRSIGFISAADDEDGWDWIGWTMRSLLERFRDVAICEYVVALLKRAVEAIDFLRNIVIFFIYG